MTERSIIPEAGAPIPVQRLGLTDMHITRVGFGAWAIGGAGWVAGWGRQDDSASIASIRHAIHRGINWIDTAAVYGLGHSEQIVRQALTGIPVSERPFVFTKCGIRWDETDRMAMPKKVGAAASIRHEAEASCAGSVLNGSISIKCTGRRTTARRLKRIGKRCST